MTTMTGQFDYALVILSIVMAVLSSLTALNLAAKIKEAKESFRKFWIIGGSITMGLGIWSMHFIGMLAFHLPISVHYNLYHVLLSMFAGIFASFIALFIVRKRETHQLNLLAGSLMMGLGISSMHYIGMNSMSMVADVHYRSGLFVLSILIAVIASYLALRVSIHFQSDSFWSKAKVGAAFIMGTAISGMHYTGMAASVFVQRKDPMINKHVEQTQLTDTVLAYAVTACIILLFVFVSIGMILDRKITIETEKRHRLRELHLLILESVEEGIIGTDKRGNTIFMNPSAYKMLGYTESEMTGQHAHNLYHHTTIHGEPYDEAYCPIYLTTCDGIARHVRDEVFWRKNGTNFPVEYHVTPISEGSEIVGTVITFTDSSERLAAEALQLERKQLEVELSVAASVQKSLLPRVSTMTLPPSSEIGVVSVPARTLNGDFYSLVADGEQIMFGVADISGKGVPAAILMSMIKFAMDEMIKYLESPDALLSYLNRFVYQNTDDFTFVSMFVAHYDSRTSTLRYSNAGHEPALLYKSRSGEFQDLTAEGNVLGLSPKSTFQSHTISLGPGDMILLYTDGIIENRNSLQMDSNTKLKTLLSRMDPTLDAQAIVEMMYDSIANSNNGVNLDDQTLLLFRKTYY